MCSSVSICGAVGFGLVELGVNTDLGAGEQSRHRAQCSRLVHHGRERFGV